MRYVIIRDDDTNAFTPVECLERLYRPFLDRGLPVNLATIPDVATGATMADGRPEGFLLEKNGERARSRPLGSNQPLVSYLHSNPGYHIVQHGLHHHWLEFDRPNAAEVAERIEQGTKLLLEAGFAQPQTFVAPYDKLSRAALREVARRFRVLSTGWFELGRLPWAWWPGYLLKKVRRTPHWRIGRTLLLSHPGCLLSYQHPASTMLATIKRQVASQRLTVLVTHWWEYFRQDCADEPFIRALHETADYLATNPELKVISFDDLVTQSIPLN